MAKDDGEWVTGPDFFEQAIDDKRTVKAAMATSPDGKQYVSIREWRVKQAGTPYYTKNRVLVPVGDDAMRQAFIDALQAVVPVPAAKKARTKK